MKEKIGFTGGVIAVIIIVAFSVYLSINDIHQNVMTWILWAFLDALITVSSIASGNKRPWLPAGYTVGSILVIIIILSRGEWHFGLIEAIATAGVFLAILIWKISGPKLAVIASTLAMTVAGIPAMYDAFLSPDPGSWWLWGGIALSCILSCYGAKGWTIEDRFFPCSSLIFNLSMLILVLR